MNKNAATHKGTCQLCGAMQMLPSGRLAKHGYTTKWGFFSGVCAGSGRLPFEQSTDAIEDAIAGVQKTIEAVAATIADLRDPAHPVNDGTDVWVRVYGDDGYSWAKAKLAVTNNVSSDGHSWASCMYTTLHPVLHRRKSEPMTDRVDGGYGCKTVVDFALHLNDRRASAFEKDNAGRANWIAWQRDRVAKWAPAPLTPR